MKKLLKWERLIEIKDIDDVLSDTYSNIAEKFTPVFISNLEKTPTTSARLSRIYFNRWNLHMDKESVPATIFNTLLTNMIRETIGDDFKDSTNELMEHYDLIIDKYYKMLTSEYSLLFDDINTKIKIEKRYDIFQRAFSKTMRRLNESYSPIMDNWKWGAVHHGHFNMPLLKEWLFYNKDYNKLQDVALCGDDSTINKGSIDVSSMKAQDVSCLSGIFHSGLLFISPTFSCPLDPHSEYYKNYHRGKDLICLDIQKGAHTFRIIPLGR